MSWSPDSNYVAYSRGLNNRSRSAIFIYDMGAKKVTQATSGYYSDASPAFSADGNYLFFTTNRTFRPVYSDMDNTFIYPNSTNIAVATLAKTTESLFPVKNDVSEIKKDDEDSKDDKKAKDKDKDDTTTASTTIDFSGLEDRVELLDTPPGNYNSLSTTKGKLVFVKFPNSGSGPGTSSALHFYDFKSREVKMIMDGVFNYTMSANGEKLLVMKNGKLAVISVGEKQKLDKTVPIDDMIMSVVPKEEWTQIFNDVWRMERDFFYDPNMHGVDWDLMKKRYGALVDQASTRTDVNIIIGDLIAELNASHTYNGGGNTEFSKRMNVGYLGADFSVSDGAFQISKILSGAPWDAEVKSPLAKPGLDINEG